MTEEIFVGAARRHRLAAEDPSNPQPFPGYRAKRSAGG